MKTPATPDMLAGCRILTFESRRRDEFRNLLEHRGATVISAPALREIPLTDQGAPREFLAKLRAGEIDALICLTGVGTKALIDSFADSERSEVLRRLREIPLIARGPKPVAALRQLGLQARIRAPEPNTWRELLATLDQEWPVRGKHLAIQEYGRPSRELHEGLQARGASILPVPVYRWALPEDTAPLAAGLGALLAGEIDIVVFTTAVQLDHLLQFAGERRDELLAILRRSVDVASIGPTASAALTELKIPVGIVPIHPKLGYLTRAIVGHVGGRRPQLAIDPKDDKIQVGPQGEFMSNASSPKTLTFMGAPGSPYTRKMRAVLRYRHIPSRMIQQMSAEHKSRPQPRVPLLPTFYLPDAEGNEVAVTDSTPLIRRFEQEYPDRRILPDNPVLAMLNDMLEDFGDEWLTKAMFHYRWAFQADVDKAASILPRWIKTNTTDEEVAPLSKFIADRQIERLSYVGSNPVTAPIIEDGYRRFLKLLSAHLAGSPFLFGDRPASADFALYGQLTCLVLFDPTPMAICVKEAPRVYAWVEHMEDLSGVEPSSENWVQPEALGPTFHALLCEFGRVYAPYLLANAEAVASGAEKVNTTIDGAAWEQNPFPYQKKCLQVLRESRKSMTKTDRDALDQILSGTGAEVIFAE